MFIPELTGRVGAAVGRRHPAAPETSACSDKTPRSGPGGKRTTPIVAQANCGQRHASIWVNDAFSAAPRAQICHHRRAGCISCPPMPGRFDESRVEGASDAALGKPRTAGPAVVGGAKGSPTKLCRAGTSGGQGAAHHYRRGSQHPFLPRAGSMVGKICASMIWLAHGTKRSWTRPTCRNHRPPAL